jgi:PAS domain S-box-containing protein
MSPAVILNVDDDDGQRYARTRVLRQAGFGVVEAGSGDEALRLARVCNPTLVLLDVHLPDKTGFEVSRILRSSPETSNIAVLHISATARGDQDRVTGLAEADGYLIEPVAPDVLVATVQALARLKQAERSLRVKERELEKERARLSAILQYVPMGVIVVEAPEGRISYVNDEAARLHGHPPREIATVDEWDWWKLFTLEGEPLPLDSYPAVRSIRLGEVVADERLLLERAGGDRIVVSANSAPLRNSAGAVDGAVLTFSDVTVRSRAEEATRESEARYRALADSLPHMIFTMTPDGLLDYVNSRGLEFAADRAELEDDKSWLGMVHPEDAGEVAAARREALARGEPYTVECRLRRSDGEYVWFRGHAVPVRDAGGRIVKWSGTYTNIEAQKQAERDLQESRARLELAMHSARLSAWEADLATGAVLVAPHPGQPFPLAAAGIGQWVEMAAPEDRTPLREAIERAAAGLADLEAQFRVAGAQRWIHLRGRRFSDGGSPAGRLMGVLQDVTGRRLAEQALRESEERYRRIVESTHDGVWLIDRRAITIFANEQMARMLGTTVAGLERRSAFEFTAPEDRAEAERLFAERLTGSGIPPSVEFRYVRPDGSVFWAQVTSSPVRDENGSISGVLGMFRDISRRRESERRMAELAEESRLQAEKAEQRARELEVSNQRFQRLIDCGIAGIAISDSEKVLEANDLFLELAGRSREDLRNQRILWRDLLAPAESGKLGGAIRQVLETGVCPPFDLEFVRPDFTRVSSLIGGSLIEAVPEPRWLAFIIDLTPLKRMEQELRSSEARLRVVLQGTPVVVWEQDLDLRYTWIYNPRAGWSGEQLVGRTDADVLAPEDAARVIALKRRVIETGESARGEFELRSQLGVQAFDMHIEPLKDAAGRCTGITGVGMEVTERHRIERALRESEERLRVTVEAAGVGTWTVNLGTGECIASAMTYALFGIGPHPPHKLEKLLAIVPEEMRQVFSAIQAVSERDPKLELEVPVRWSDASEHWLMVSGRLLPETGAGRRVMGVVLDITPLKLADVMLRRANAELARSNEDLQRFAYVISHDLQEPLRNITAFSDLLVEKLGEGIEPETGEFLGFIVSGGQRMRRMITDLLEYSRFGYAEPVRKPIRASLALSWALMNLSRTLTEAGGEVSSGELPDVLADDEQLMRVFQNLIGNAIKYRHPERPLRVWVSAEREERGMWRFAVRDNGIGIEPRFRDRIFGVFQRLHGRNVPGTGIGLAICERIVSRHGGRIWVESEPGEGATFYFTLPEAAGEAQAQ